MLLYNLNLSLITLVYIYSEIKKITFNTTNTKFFSIVIFLSLWLVSGLRYMVGTDFINYKNYFENVDLYSIDNPLYEKGYFALNYVINLLTHNQQYVFLVTSFIVIFLITKTLKDYSVSYMFSIVLFITMYFYYDSFNLVRQYIAVSLIFFSIRYIFNKNLIKFLIIVGIASLFHGTALVMIPFYWLLRIKFNHFVYICSLIIIFLLSFTTNTLVGLVSSVFTKYSVYTNYSIENSSANAIMVITSVVFIFSLIHRKKLLLLDERSLIYINCVFFAVVFTILSRENILFFRVAIYFYIFCLLLIPICLKVINVKLRPAIYILILLSMGFYHFYLLSNNNAGVVPYSYNLSLFEK